MKEKPHPHELRYITKELARLREYPAAIRHPEIGNPLKEAEEWATKEYKKVSEDRK